MPSRFVSLTQLKDRLAPLLEAHPEGAVVFDADGTLWSHDVGCMVYDAACALGAFRSEALEHLRREAAAQGIALTAVTANDAAVALQKAWYGGRYDERAAAEMQVWAYVGFAEDEFRAFVRTALTAGSHSTTLHDDVLHLAQWVREQGRRACIVSASPLWVVQEATRELGFSDEDIAAGLPNTTSENGIQTIRAGLAHPLPYGPDKVVAGRALLRGAEWIAALGDSHFDLEMMRAARVGVGIGEKRTMLEGLLQMSHAVRLQLTR